MKPESHETELVGRWVLCGEKVQWDATSKRIEWLTAHYFRNIATSQQGGGWETLFQDPGDGRFWERTYPQGELQGGGPPKLTVVSAQQARAKYPLG